MKFCDVLNNYTEILSCTAKELCALSGISAATFSRYKRGERVPELGSDSFENLCRAIEKTAEQKNAYSFSSCKTVYPGFDCERAGVDSYLLLCALYETCGYRPEGLPLFDGFDAAASVMKINA